MKKILIVDDNIETLEVLKTSLERHEYAVFTAKSCKETRELLLSTNTAVEHDIYDIVILDLTLPDGDGIEICSHLRLSGFKTPIIMLTARDNISDKVIGLDCGADDYIVKPFEIIELLARIKACLRRYSEAATENIIYGDIIINLRKRHVIVRGKEVIFTPKELDLLTFFISQKGIPISRNKIREEIWKDTILYSWSRTIDVHIQHIR
ncbi:MAG: response regulator transcription factor [Nitrospirae bacterium]|nr:response regulator transcription factor [Nitrospirota bacterium]